MSSWPGPGAPASLVDEPLSANHGHQPHAMTMKLHAPIAIVALSAALAFPARAQQAPAPAETKNEILQLQPFTVSSDQDKGYRATRTVSASRLNIPLNEVPINIPVITSDFVMDAVSFTQREALEWHSAVEGKSVRGFDTSEFYRHGFQHLSDTQGFLIQRMEIVRGPTAVLNGPIHPGGGINVITKQAVLGSTFGETMMQYTAGEGHNLTAYGFDYNAGNLGPAADWGSRAALRVVAGYQEDSGRAIGVGNKYFSNINSLRLRPLENTVITLEYYHYKLESDRTDHHLAVNNAKTIPGTFNGTTTSGAVPLYAAYNIPYWASWNGPDGITPEVLDELYFNLNQRLADGLYFDFSYNRHDRNLDFKNVASHGNPGGGFTLVQKPGSNGNIYNPANYLVRRGLRKAHIGNVTDQISALLTFAPEINGRRNHRFLGGYQSFEQKRRLLFADAFLKSNGTQRYYQFFDPANYRNETEQSLSVDFSQFFYNYGTPAVDSREANEQSTLFLTYNGKWLNDRLVTMAGWFNTDMNQKAATGNGAFVQRFDGSKSLPQVGFVYSVNEDFGFYGVYTRSSAINANQAPPANNPNFFFPPKSGEMRELGLRFDLLDNKLNASVGFYQINQTDLVSIDAATGNVIQLGDIESRGLDLDLFYNPLPDWSVIFSYSYNDKTVPTTTSAAADSSVFRSPPNKWSIWNKYTFSRGLLKDVSIGGGFRWAEGTPFSIAGVSGVNPAKTRADAFIQKRGKLSEKVSYSVALNIRNLTRSANLSNNVVLGSETYTGARPGTSSRYEFSTDPEYTLTYGLQF